MQIIVYSIKILNLFLCNAENVSFFENRIMRLVSSTVSTY